MEQLFHDMRFAARTFARSRGFTAVALLTLALGIGANSAIFSLVNGVLLRPLGYPKPEQLMYLTTRFASTFPQFWVSPPEYMEFRELNRSFSAVGAYTTGEANLTAGDRPMRVRVASVDEHLLNALALAPERGRLFGPGETDVTGPPPVPGQTGPPRLPPSVAILSHELWQRAYGGRPIVGEMVEIDGRRREVIGVMPPGADVMDNRTEVWLPLGLNPANRQNRGNHFLYLVGRLKDGVTVDAAQRDLDQLIANWGDRAGIKRGPGASGHLFTPPTVQGGHHVLQMKPLQDQMLGGASRSIWVLQAAVGVVLLIACANLANLLLARAESRQREFAVRTAIGATNGQLLRQLILEGVVLSLAGGMLGLFLAQGGVKALVSAYPATLPRIGDVSVDPMVLLFTFAISTGSGILFGLAPFLHARLYGMVNSLKEGGAKGATGGRHRVRRGLVAVEVALAVVVVVGASLLVRTVYNLTNIDAGFNRSRLLTFSMTLPPATYQAPARAQRFQDVLDGLRAVPGVQGAAAMTGLPPNRPVNANDTEIDNYTAPPQGPWENVDYYQAVTSGYFETMGIPIVQGRGFEPADAASPAMVAVVNETLVNTFWKGLNPVGQRLRPCCGDQVPWRTVIGVAKDVKQGGVDQKTGTELYFFVDQTARHAPPPNNVPVTMHMVVRTGLQASAVAPAIERIVRDTAPSVPVARFREMEDVFAETIQRPWLLAQLTAGFAGLALLLAAIGTYGVLSFMVVERRREIGIRLALGQDRLSVLTHVMRQGLVLTAIGIVTGTAAALALNRLIASLLFGVRPTDPVTLVAVVATIAIVAASACWLPAWRASRLDPNVILREE
jgi:predicted permease